MKEKILKIPPTNEKTSQNQDLQQKSHQRIKFLCIGPCKIFGTILKMDKGGTQTNRPKDKKVDDDDAISFTFEIRHRKIICVKKRRKLAVKITWMHQYEG